ncbi:alpha/beta fold hydrolase [Paenibacillus sp. CGMCC 1.16610]|uniref:Alpha/beta fold hydrolase n=1 Tax=Paenibacillus anseongense TaxID=2682845 RepID=A0ABW9UIP0_9BACL|nr:alpha/beta fold hydrolase [Paenibacillus sp. CGMCC 1.16610]MBA2939726.1 alpha/beta fold hydrolase [Paenibacillus sp. CGMCC 1.16610]MVQ39386.1 alpha/beta fold hydrolase [Paenibacillus anseongense]
MNKGVNDKLSNALKSIMIMVLVLTIIIGCTSQEAVVDNDQPEKSGQTPNKQSGSPSEEDGIIVSKELVDVAGQNPKINIYKIFYISDGTKVEAFLSEPKESGKYPLHVTLHGGWAYERPNKTHDSFGFQAESLKNVPENVVRIAPQYRGYMGSDGSVQGLAGNTLDTRNAIKAAMSWGNVLPDSIFLTGASMGGGVALRTASERKDIKAVVAVSPFVGWDTIIQWMDNNTDGVWPDNVQKERKLANEYKDIFSKNPGKEKENSLLDRIPDIQAPVLLLQGTADESVVWQTVQEFANRMKERNKTIKLILYPNGGHGLKDQYQSETSKEIDSWLTEYGLSQISKNPQ